MMLGRFRKLVEQHQHRVYTFSYYFLGNKAEAEDVTQEVLLRLWRHIESVEPESAGAWLTRVTRNACYDALRKRRTHGRVFADGLDDEDVARAADGGRSPEEAVSDAEVRRRFEEALEKVAEPYRSIVILREVQGLKYRQIADALELPLNTVKTYLHRARRKLREELREVYSYAETT